MRRRELTPFSLSFLDVMFCGFGAVVLLVMLLSGQSRAAREQLFPDLRAEVVKVQKQVLIGRKDLVEARNALDVVEKEKVRTEGKAKKVDEKLKQTRIELAKLDAETLSEKSHVNQLKADLKQLDEAKKRLQQQSDKSKNLGKQVHRVVGDGQRQYLTGLKLGGKRVLILVDKSASMLAPELINIIRLRNMNDARKRQAKKWRQTVASAEWIVANLPASSQYQVVTFDQTAQALMSKTAGRWLKANDKATVEKTVAAIKQLLPGGGSSLIRAFRVAKQMTPRPDNIILVTDGLPTLGSGKPSSSTIDADDRLELFNKAVRVLPSRVPVNTILLAMEGDPYASSAYWHLAVNSNGSLINPSEDWP